MGFRYRKSVNFGPLRINLSKSGIGYSVGTKGVRYTKKANGGTRTTLSIPSSGLSYVKETGRKKSFNKGNAYSSDFSIGNILLYGLLFTLIFLLIALEIVFVLYALAGAMWASVSLVVLGLTFMAGFVGYYVSVSRKRARLDAEKKEVFANFKAQGFKSTHQYKVSGQLFAIDENSRQWFVMRYADPKSARLHRFEDIRGYERRENAQTQTVGTGVAATSWLGVASFASQKVYTKLGVLVSLNDIKHPTEFISCMGNEDGVDEVLNILDIITGR